MADNKKQERDFTVEVDALLPAAESLAKVCLSLFAQDTPVIDNIPVWAIAGCTRQDIRSRKAN
jgi:hypothetical protein